MDDARQLVLEMTDTVLAAAPRSRGDVLPAPMYRVLEVPRHDDADPSAPPGASPGILSALVGAHVLGSPLAVCWVRTGPYRHVNVLVGPATLAAEAGEDGEEARLIFPPGTVARRLAADETAPILARIPAWVSCGGTFDPIRLDAEQDATPARGGGSIEDAFGHLSHAALAWLVLAEPLERARVKDLLEALAFTFPHQRNLAESSEAARIALERDEAWYRELERAAPTGLWQLRVLAGAADPADALRLAALLCNTDEVRALPYRLQPSGRPTKLMRVLEDGGSDACPGPFLAAHELAAAVARPPFREIPGVRLVKPPPFDVTSEASGPFGIGEILDAGLRRCGRMNISTSTLNRHAFVCGATGSGKSQTVRTLLESVTGAGIPWLVIEPAKAEYASGMAGRLKDADERVVVIRPGDSALIPGSLNPLEPEPGFPLQSHADMVRALFVAAFDADEPFPQVLSYALTRCYEQCGWDLALSRATSSWLAAAPPRYPSLRDLQDAAKSVVDEIGYGKEVSDNVRGFVDVRIRSLRMGSPGRFFEGGHPLDMALLMTQRVVFEMEDVANDQDKAFLIGVILIRLFEHLRVRFTRDGTPGLRHVTVVEEAHRLLRNVDGKGPASQSIELFANLLAEIRAYGEGIVVAEQIPNKVISDLIKNTALKIVHRLPAADDRDAVGGTMNLTAEQSEYVVTLTPGRAAVFADGMDNALLAAITYKGEEREHGRPELIPPIGRSRRSVTCGAHCRQRACTFEEMRLAQELGETMPALWFWVELAFVAHISGERMSGPAEALRADLRAVDARRLECAVSQLASAAAEARYGLLRTFYRPEGLSEHVVAHVLHAVAGGDREPPCAGAELEWRAGARRWQDVRVALLGSDADRSVPHPFTALWRERGLRLPDAGWDVQRAAVLAHPWSRYPPKRQRQLELGNMSDPDGTLAESAVGRALLAMRGSASRIDLDDGLKTHGFGAQEVLRRRIAGVAPKERG